MVFLFLFEFYSHLNIASFYSKLQAKIWRLLLRNISNLLIPLIEQQQGFNVNASINNFNVLQSSLNWKEGFLYLKVTKTLIYFHTWFVVP